MTIILVMTGVLLGASLVFALLAAAVWWVMQLDS
jgi:hypothetical protein